ncbi:MAG: RNA-binding protein, partial [Eubacterium sp.]|nr:RNA-binding protein [Eubacterium sp.]
MIEKRLTELYNRACQRDYTTFSDFLNMDEQSVLESSYLPCVKFGGYSTAERIVAAFGDNPDTADFPIVLLQISPVSEK